MAFTQAEDKTKTGRGAISIVFYIPDPTKPSEVQAGQLTGQVHYSDGSTEEKRFDLLERLQDDVDGQVHLSNLVDLRDYIIARWDDEVVGIE